MLGHSCRAVLCETPHYDEHPSDCSCKSCHNYHIEEGIKDFWSSCLVCADVMAWDIQRGFRCMHGNFIPDGYVTDIECQECEESYDYSF